MRIFSIENIAPSSKQYAHFNDANRLEEHFQNIIGKTTCQQGTETQGRRVLHERINVELVIRMHLRLGSIDHVRQVHGGSTVATIHLTYQKNRTE
jgi:hypothetical protein